MSEEKMTASLSIDAKYVEGEVSRIVKAAIVFALGNRDEIIERLLIEQLILMLMGAGTLAEKAITGQDHT